jgi:hypothetical protein
VCYADKVCASNSYDNISVGGVGGGGGSSYIKFVIYVLFDRR